MNRSFNDTKRSSYRAAAQSLLVLLMLFGITGRASAQRIESDLEKLMVKYEIKVLDVYQEIQALEATPQAVVEREAFHRVLSGYTDRVLEMYSTLERIKEFTLQNYRNIVARSLIFRALAYVESGANLEQACKDYRRALILSRDSKIPVINQTLPYEVWADGKVYTRLADLIDDKDENLVLLRCMRSSEKTRQVP